jgi:hypothetical protein
VQRFSRFTNSIMPISAAKRIFSLLVISVVR